MLIYDSFFFKQTVVQVETLGEFGVFFILFAVGLEFSPDRIKQVMRLEHFCSHLKAFVVTF